MKNLIRTAYGSTQNLAKFVWNNQQTPETQQQSSSIENAVEKLQADTRERLDALKMSKQKSEAIAERVVLDADKKMEKVKAMLSDGVDAGEVAKVAGLTKKGNGEANNIFRTEMVARLNKYLSEEAPVSYEDASKIMLEAMKQASFPDNWPLGDKWRNGKIIQKGKLYYASRMIRYGKSRLSSDVLKRFRGYGRTELAKEMSKGPTIELDGTGTMEFDGKNYVIDNMEILTGAAMTKVNPLIAQGFVIENVMKVEGPNGPQLIATMKNGCKGNFVIIDLVEKGDNPVIKEGKRCENGVWVIYNVETGETIRTTSEKCGDDGECMDCDKIKALTTYKTFLDGNLNNCFDESVEDWDKKSDAEKIEINMRFLEKNGFFEQMAEKGLLPKNWDDLNYQGKYKALSENKQALAMALGQEAANVENIKTLSNFLHEVFKKGGIKDDLLKLIDGRTFEGGVIGWITQLPKLFMSKDAKTKQVKRQISRKLGWKLSEFDSNWESLMTQFNQEMVTFRKGLDRAADKVEIQEQKLYRECKTCVKNVNNEIAKQLEAKGYDSRAVAAFRNAGEKGIGLSQALKLLPTDILVSTLTFVGQVVAAGGFAGLTGPALATMAALSLVLSDIKLPYFLGGGKLTDMPSLDAIASTKWGDAIGNNYSRAAKKNFAGLDKGKGYIDAAMQRSATESREDYAKEMELLSPALQKTVDALVASLTGSNQEDQEGLVDFLIDEILTQQRVSFKFLEDTDGRRGVVRRAKRKLKKALKEFKHSGKTEEDARKFLSSHISETMADIQKALIEEVNDDFHTNFDFAGFNKEIINDKEFTISLKNGKIKATIEKFVDDRNGRIGLRVKEGTLETAGRFAKHPERAKDKLKKVIDEMTTRLNGVKSLHGLSTSIDFYINQANERNVRIDVIKEGNAEYWGILTRMRKDPKALNTILNFNEKCSECPAFSYNVRLLIDDFVKAKTIQEQEVIFDKLMDERTGFKEEYENILNKMAQFQLYEKDGKVYYTKDGGKTYEYCTPEEIPRIKQEYQVYTQIVDRMHPRFHGTAAFFKPAIEKIPGVDEVVGSISKNSHILSLSQDEFAAWANTQPQWQGLGITGYEVITDSAGNVLGINLLRKGTEKTVVKFTKEILAKNLTIGILANVIGRAFKFETQNYNPDNYAKGPALKDTVEINGERYVKLNYQKSREKNVTKTSSSRSRTEKQRKVTIDINDNKETKEIDRSLIEEFKLLTGDGNGIKKFAEEHQTMFSKQVLNNIRSIPKDSIVSMSRVLTENGKIIELDFHVDCSNCKIVGEKAPKNYEVKNGVKIIKNPAKTPNNSPETKETLTRINVKVDEDNRVAYDTGGNYIGKIQKDTKTDKKFVLDKNNKKHELKGTKGNYYIEK